MVDTMIKLFESNATIFTTLGIGVLPDARSCTVVEERNGIFELEMEYPITGFRYSDLQLRHIVVAKPNPYEDPQPFRIYSISKPLNGFVTVNAEHISYDLSSYPVSPFAAGNEAEAMTALTANSIFPCPFTFQTMKASNAGIQTLIPTSIRSLLGGIEGSILDTYGGEYKFNNYLVQLYQNRGADRGVTIRYGKNMTDLNQEENCQAVYTGVYPYWYSDENGLFHLPEKTVNVPGTYDFVKILILDCSSEFDEKPTEIALRNYTTEYISNNNIGIPKVSLTVSFVQLAQSEEYKNYMLLENVYLCDTVHIIFEKMQVDATAKCITTKYNVITNKYISIELGDVKSNFAATISDQNTKIDAAGKNTGGIKRYVNERLTEASKATDQRLQEITNDLNYAVKSATQSIVGGLGGYVLIRSSTGGTKPDEILIMDTENILTATKVWRWNKNGLGYSSTGYNGPYSLAMTANGQIVADFIKTGTLTAINIVGVLISGSTLISESGTYRIEIRDGKLIIKDTSINNSGLEIGYKYDLDRHMGYATMQGSLNDTIDIRTDLNDSNLSAISLRIFANANNWAGWLIEENFSWRGTSGGIPWGELEIAFGSGHANNLFIVRGGSKNAVVETEQFGDVYFSSYETSEIYFGVIGEGIIQNGTCQIKIPPKLLACSNMDLPYQVFLQKYGSGDVWVEKRDINYFVVKGDNIPFAYEIKTRRKNFENYNFGNPIEEDEK